MSELGLKAYRFSIAWPRVLPLGKGRANKKGLDFYQQLVDELLQADIDPYVTLYHWDLPQALQEKGGWAERDTVYYFRDYATLIFETLGDRVDYWMTINEPWVISFLGHEEGKHAPGQKNLKVALQVSHHLLLAHGETVKVFDEYRNQNSEIGIILNLSPVEAASKQPEDLAAAERLDGELNRWFLDPVLKGRYPADLRQLYGSACPLFEKEDLETIHLPIDFLGINHYCRIVVVHDPRGGRLKLKYPDVEGARYTDMGWEIYPEALYFLLKRLKRDYDIPSFYITENGAAFQDSVDMRGQVEDYERINFLKGALSALARAIEEGIPVKGYFVWSLLDNFEWSYGYAKRFGIVYVDYPTQKRIVKKSGGWYKNVIENNGII